MESVIKWRTSTIEKQGKYIITLKNGMVIVDDYYMDVMFNGNKQKFFRTINEENILAWCPLSEIEPYKEKDGTSRLK